MEKVVIRHQSFITYIPFTANEIPNFIPQHLNNVCKFHAFTSKYEFMNISKNFALLRKENFLRRVDTKNNYFVTTDYVF